MKNKFLKLGLALCLVVGWLLTASPVKADVTTWPVDGFWNDPYDPSIFDQISFGLYGETPLTWACQWYFGDGTTYDQCYVNRVKRYAQDGDYLVTVQVTNDLDEVSTTSRVLSVRTHDVAITKVSVPQSAHAGQTRQIVVSVSNTHFAEMMFVDLWKSAPGGFEGVGTLKQLVPVRAGNRTTAFYFSYTFTSEDARVGKVTFKAIATLLDARDALPADNEVVALPTRVAR